jgi:hypothetical protein
MKHTIESDIIDIDKPSLIAALEKKGVSVVSIERARTVTQVKKSGQELEPLFLKARIIIETDGEKKLTKKKIEELQEIVDEHKGQSKAKSVAELEALLKHVQEQIKLLKDAK